MSTEREALIEEASWVLGEAVARILGRLTIAGFGEHVLVDDVIDILNEIHAERRVQYADTTTEPTDEQVEAAALAYAAGEMSDEEWEWVKTQPEVIQPYLDGMRAALKAAMEVKP